MKNVDDFDSGVDSSYGFHDDLLLALERSGKDLVEIQSIILPWNNTKRADMITLGGVQYPNDEACYSNRIRKKIRIQELLNATFAAKEQADAAFIDAKEKFKKATQEKESSDRRYKYLAGVVKKEFSVTKSRKRKSAGEVLASDYFGTLHDFRSKKQRADDCSEDDKEEFSLKEEEPKKEELSGHRLERTPIELLSGNWRASNVKYESQSESRSSVSPYYSPVKTEPSEGLTNFQPTTRRPSPWRRSAAVDYLDFKMDMSSLSTSASEISRDGNVHQRNSQQPIGRGPLEHYQLFESMLQRRRGSLTPSSTSQMPENAKNSTRTWRHATTTTPSLAQTGSQSPADTPRTSNSEPSIPETDRSSIYKSEFSNYDAKAEPSLSNTSDAGIAEAATTAGSIHVSGTESDMSSADFDYHLIPSVSAGSYSAAGGEAAGGSDMGTGSNAEASEGLAEEPVEISSDEESE